VLRITLYPNLTFASRPTLQTCPADDEAEQLVLHDPAVRTQLYASPRPVQMMFYLWPKYTGLVQKAVAEFMKRNGAGETPKETLKDLPQRLIVRHCRFSRPCSGTACVAQTWECLEGGNPRMFSLATSFLREPSVADTRHMLSCSGMKPGRWAWCPTSRMCQPCHLNIHVLLVGATGGAIVCNKLAGDWRADTPAATQAVLKLTEEQEEDMVEAYTDMMARLTAIFARHQSMLVAVADHQALPEYSNGMGTTTVRRRSSETAGFRPGVRSIWDNRTAVRGAIVSRGPSSKLSSAYACAGPEPGWVQI